MHVVISYRDKCRLPCLIRRNVAQNNILQDVFDEKGGKPRLRSYSGDTSFFYKGVEGKDGSPGSRGPRGQKVSLLINCIFLTQNY